MDTDFVPVGERRLRQILDGVVAEGDAAEGHHLELKSAIDLGTPLGQAKVAKFVLGAANRLPQVAATRFGGYAVMVLGVGKGAALGVAGGVEVHQVHAALGKYLGPDGPPFDLARLPAGEGREVLFVLVDPPQAGQAVWLCHKAYQPEGPGERKYALADGAVYVRVDGETRPAKAVEMKALLARGAAPAGGSVDLQVEVLGAVRRILDVDEPLEAWLDQAGNAYREEQRKVRAEYVQHLGHTAQGLLRNVRESAPEQVEARLDEWRRNLTAQWPARSDVLLGAALGGVGVRLVNDAASYLGRPEVDVTFHGCRGVEWSDAAEIALSEVFPPVEPAQRSPLRAWTPLGERRSVRLASYPVRWANTEEGLVVSVRLDDLRPHKPWESGTRDVVVLAGGEVGEQVRVTWSATAQDRGQRFTGETVVDVAPSVPALDVYRRLRRILSQQG